MTPLEIVRLVESEADRANATPQGANYQAIVERVAGEVDMTYEQVRTMCRDVWSMPVGVG